MENKIVSREATEKYNANTQKPIRFPTAKDRIVKDSI